MKKFANLLAFTLLLTFFTACNKEEEQPATVVNTDTNGTTSINNILLGQQLNALPKVPLSQDETESILLMREEEKMARDAYLVFYQQWPQPVFTNISKAEQTHMDAVLLLVNKYGLTDPVGTNPVGTFINNNIQDLYNAFIVQGNASYTEALKAGAAIEEVDIRDLQNMLNEDDINNQDIELVYSNLLKGSRNHLRSFVKVLKNQGITYVPQYLSQSEYNAIINSPLESGQ
jgi:hypothetical protein